MNYSPRTDNDDFIQPIKMMYTKTPQRAAFENLQIFNVQLPEFRKKKHDLTDKLDAWLYILDTAEQEKKTVVEVISMDETLRTTVKEDPGLQQFIENYDRISASGEMRKEYFGYIQGIYYLNGIQRSAYLDGKTDTAREMLLEGFEPEKIAKITHLPIETIQEIQLNP
jgi:predicted transposase/invertase (TIGR01784 family)